MKKLAVYRSILFSWVFLWAACDDGGLSTASKKKFKQNPPPTGDDARMNPSGDSSEDTSDPGKILSEESSTKEDNVLYQPGASNQEIIIDSDEDSARGPIDNPTEEQIIQLKRECWFAVSGTFMGYGAAKFGSGNSNYRDRFPATNSGREIQHLERFDTVGGVFLQARSTPYVFGDGEIDAAVNWTFDSIAVPPNMQVEIKMGNETIAKQGPVYAISRYYADRSRDVAQTLKNWPDAPSWMKDYLKDRSQVEVFRLQSARSVKVSVVEGSRCDCPECGW